MYYKYVPPIVYYNTSNPYATTYYANGYEYVPNWTNVKYLDTK
ncbi:putative cell-wall-anchored protein SasA (LPXTG motif) [Lactococcus lactis subsp. lactis]|nr:putative cell-wall-anchored protein SasA (LPXTG motif) [Lactococcus lactis subsp. lactis]